MTKRKPNPWWFTDLGFDAENKMFSDEWYEFEKKVWFQSYILLSDKVREARPFIAEQLVGQRWESRENK